MKKIFALLLILVLTLSLVACSKSAPEFGLSEQETEKVETLNAEDIIGTWKGSSKGKMSGVYVEVNITCIFNTKVMKVIYDENDLRAAYEKVYQDEEAVKLIFSGASMEQFNEYLESRGMTSSDFAEEQAKNTMEETKYTFDGTMLTFEKEIRPITYENGTLSFKSWGTSEMTYTLTKQ